MITKNYLNDLSYRITGVAIEVHKQLGPGLLESAYQKCFAHELAMQGFNFLSQLIVPINYKGLDIETDFRLDFLVEEVIVVELKAIDALAPVHEAQLLTYMKLLAKPKGILINFNVVNIVKEGSRQMVNEYFRDLSA